MSSPFADPNQEVEAWKDAFYNDFRKVPVSDLENYLDKEADRILERHHIRRASIRNIMEPELAAASK